MIDDDDPDLEPLAPVLEACVATCVPLMTPELWFAGKWTPLHECVGTLASGPGYPPQSAAFVFAAQHAVANVPGDAMLNFMARAADLRDQPAEEQDRVIRSMAKHTTSTLESVAGDRAQARPKGPPDLRGAWQELGNAMSSLSFGLRDLGGRQHGAGPRVEPGSGAAIEWYGVSEDLAWLRREVAHVLSVLPKASSIPERTLPLDVRWGTRAQLLIQEIEASLGPVVDSPAIRGSHAVVGARLLNQSVARIGEWLAASCERWRSLDAALKLHGSVRAPSATDRPGLKTVEWCGQAVAPNDRPLRRSFTKKLRALKDSGTLDDAMVEMKDGQELFDVEMLLEIPELSDYHNQLEKAFANNMVTNRRRRSQ